VNRLANNIRYTGSIDLLLKIDDGSLHFILYTYGNLH